MAISIGSVEVDVIPNTKGILARLTDALVPAATAAGEEAGKAAGKAFGPAMAGAVDDTVALQIGEKLGQKIADRIAAAVRDALKDGITIGGQKARPAATRQGEETGGAFSRSLRVKLIEAFRSMPKLDVKLSDTGVDAELARLRARMETLSNKRIGIDVDVAVADAEIADIEARLRRLGAAHPNVAVRADTAAARAQLAAIREEIDRISTNPARVRVDVVGAFGQKLRAEVAAAQAALPDIRIDADTSEAQADLIALRVQLGTLSQQRVGIDIDAATALARVEEIRAELARLSASSADVSVRVDAAAAQARLVSVQAMVAALDGQTARIDIDTAGALSAVFQLSVAILGLAALPVFPVLAAGVGLFTSAVVAAAVGVGALAAVAVPAVVGIAGALQAQKAAQDAATNSALKGGQAAGQGAAKALQLAGAQQALATAERNGARQIAQAQQQVVQAKQAAADAVVQAALRNQQAARQVEDSERQLARAQKDAKQAQLDLTAARKQAAQELEDLANKYADAQLAQRDADIQVKEARQDLNKTLADPKATDLQRQQAQLAYDQAVQHLKEQTLETGRLKDQQAEAAKKGVEGSDAVRQAQDKVSQSLQDVVLRTRDVKDAQAEAARTQQETARQIAEAQRRVSEATANVAVAQQNAADAVSSAQRQIASASQQAAGGVDQAAVAQAKYQEALAKLSPAARATFDAFLRLRDAFKAWSVSLQPEVMPLFTRGLDGIRRSLPGLTPFVQAAAKAVGELQDRVSRDFKSPWWIQFKAELSRSVYPALLSLGVFFGQTFKGLAGVVDAFLPHFDEFGTRLNRLGGRFATWGTGLKGSPEFERFLAYSSEHAPLVGEAFRKIAGAFLDLSKALGPLADVALQFLISLSEGLSWLATNLPGLIQLMYSLFLATRAYAIAQVAVNTALVAYRGLMLIVILLTQGWTAAIFEANLAFEANPVVAIVTAIVVALVLLVLGIKYAWQHWDWFRNSVLAVWTAIQAAALWVWSTVLKPTFDAIVAALQAVGRWAMWLWQNVLSPVFSAISTAARILIVTVLTVLVGPWVVAFQLLASIATWLWQTVLSPLFGAIGAAASWLWNNALAPFVNSSVGGFQRVGAAAAWLYTSGIKPAVDGIAAVAVWLWSNVIQPVVGWIVGRFQVLAGAAMWLWQTGIAPAVHGIGDAFSWLWRSAVQPIFGWIADKASWLYDHGIKPPFDAMKSAVGLVASAFDKAKNDIKSAWDKVEDIARKPVQYVVDIVYNKGIRGVWNKIAGAFGAPELKEFTFASGGIMPGYTPGRDVHRFISPTGGALELSGGEAIMRPEFTRAVGSGFIGAMNSIAKTGGAQGVKAALAPVFGGNPSLPTDRSLRYAGGGLVQRFGDGGIFGWISDAGSALQGAGSAAWNGIKKGAQWLADTLEASARAGVKHVVDPLLAGFPGMDTGIGKMIRNIPNKIIDALFGYSKKADDKGAGGIGGPRIQAGLNWAKTQAGKPYQWAGDGNPSWDCSGFVSAIESVIRGQTPPHRRWATGAFSGDTAPPGWVLHGNSPYKIGITNAGVGHTAGTLGKTNVESRGGAGVLVGSAARGFNDSLFQDWYGFQPGQYDSGGYLQPGMNLAYNGTGRPEPVFTTQQANALLRQSTTPAAGGGVFEGDLYLDSGAFLGHVRGEVRQEMAGLTSVLEARRGR
ncbi:MULTISPECIES: hypothetical protein [unclassified Streptomyces]|uniref:hypothetical protein n=1 Tax=unclassified Streptomyces TaxID=2593676 RepID=UPI0033FB2032